MLMCQINRAWTPGDSRTVSQARREDPPRLLGEQRAGLCAVYIIGVDGAWKIGRSKHPSSRLRQLQIGSPAELRLFGIAWFEPERAEMVEAACHYRFRQFRIHSEWFVAEFDELWEYISEEWGCFWMGESCLG